MPYSCTLTESQSVHTQKREVAKGVLSQAKSETDKVELKLIEELRPN